MTPPGSERTAAASPMLAVALTRRGWQVFPVKPDKSPRVLRGLHDATTNDRAIANWVAMWPDTGVAVRTGAESGLVVLDVDPGHGGDDTLHGLEREHGPLPATVECLTGGGGRHLYFAHPGEPVRNSAGRLAPGLDIRGDGGYVVATPSPHPSGRRYEWSVEGDPDDTPVAELPEWLFERIRAPAARRRREPAATWEKLLSDGLAHGARNTGLTRLVGHLLARDVAPQVVYLLAATVNRQRCRPPLADGEMMRIVESIAGRELQKRGRP